MSGVVPSKEVTYSIIGAAIKVHESLGPGLPEGLHHEALFHELLDQDIPCESHVRSPLIYKGEEIDLFEADLIALDSIVLELKHATGAFVPAHVSQLLTYLKHWSHPLGYLFNFGLGKLATKRMLYAAEDVDASWVDEEKLKPEFREILRHIVPDVINELGTGYPSAAYLRALEVDMDTLGLRSELEPSFPVEYGIQNVGVASASGSVVLQGRYLVHVMAFAKKIAMSDLAKARSYAQHLGCEAAVVINFGSREIQIQPT